MTVTVGLVGGGVVAERLRTSRATGTSSWRRDVAAPIVVLAMAGPHAEVAARLVAGGSHVVSTSGSSQDVRELLDLDGAARDAGVTLVVGAAVSPGSERPVRPAPGERPRRLRRGPRRRARYGRAGVRPRAP